MKLSPITPSVVDRLPPPGEEPGSGSDQIASPIGPRPWAKTNTLPRFPKGGLWLPKGSAERTITLEAIRVAELAAADPLTGGLTVVACQLLPIVAQLTVFT
jgi:hypothetical protein